MAKTIPDRKQIESMLQIMLNKQHKDGQVRTVADYITRLLTYAEQRLDAAAECCVVIRNAMQQAVQEKGNTNIIEQYKLLNAAKLYITYYKKLKGIEDGKEIV